MTKNKIHEACYNQDIESVKEYLAGISPAMLNKKLTDYSNPVQGTPLHIACTNGNIEIVKLLVEAGANIELKNVALQSPLSIAAEKNHGDIAEYLIDKGADIHSRGPNGLQPIHFACSHGKRNIIELLLSRGVDINILNHKNSLLDFTTNLEGGNLEATKTLVENGIDKKYFTPAFKEACWRNNSGIAGYLLKCGADYKSVTTPKSELLFWICGLGYVKTVGLLLSLDVDFKTKVKFRGRMMSYDGSPLDRAIALNQTAVVELINKSQP